MNYLEKILKKLKHRKSITYEELNNLVPEDIILEEHIEEIIHFFNTHNIAINTGHKQVFKIEKKYDKDIIIDNLIDTPDKFYFYELNKNKKINLNIENILLKKLLGIKNKIKNLLIETDFFLFELFSDIIKTKPIKNLNSFFIPFNKDIKTITNNIKTLFKQYINNKKELRTQVELISYLQKLNFKFTYILDKIKLLKQIHNEIKNSKIDYNKELLKKIKRKKIDDHLIKHLLPELNYLLNKYNNTKQKLINNQLPLVLSIVKHYFNENFNHNDLIQEGNIAIIEALDYYDPEFHKKEFYQFVSSWVRNRVKKFLEKNNSLITVSQNFQKDCKLFLKTAGKLKEQLLRKPAINEIKAKLNWSEKKINAIVYYLQKEISLEKENNYTQLNLRDAIFDKFQKLPEDIAIDKILKEQIMSIINQLPEREQFIIKMRFGFNYDNRTLDYKEIAKNLELTENEIKNIEEYALKKLRIIFKKNNMEEFI